MVRAPIKGVSRLKLIILPDQNVPAIDVHSHTQADNPIRALCLGCVGSSKPDEDIVAFADDVSQPTHILSKQSLIVNTFYLPFTIVQYSGFSFHFFALTMKQSN